MCGDFNAHNTLWGGMQCDKRGKVIEDIIEKNNLCVLNDGSQTFIRGCSYSSVLDLTICSHDTFSDMVWHIDVETHGSDHLPILVQYSKAKT